VVEASELNTKLLQKPVFLYSLSFAFVGFLLPIISKGMGASALQIGGLFSIFTVSTLVLRPITGWFIDRFGRKPVLVFALILFAFSRSAYIFADSIPRLYLARFISGFSILFLSVSIVTMIADMSSPTGRGREMGRLNEMAARSNIIGVTLGFSFFMFLPRDRAWQLAFVMYTVAALIAAWIVLRKVPESQPSIQKTDRQNLVQSTFSVQLVKLMFIVFVTGMSGSLTSPIFLIYLQDKFTTKVWVLALAFLPGGLVNAFFAKRLGGLSDRFGRVQLMVIGLVVGGIVSIFIPLTPALLLLVGLFMISNAAVSVLGPAQAAMVADIVGEERRGMAYGLFDFALNLGVTLGPLLGGWLYDTEGKATPFFLNGVILIICAGWVLLFMRKHSQEMAAAED
jgi:MFS transporter, DHA1 family, multidrug resistance protein